jgi:hypothetical protein
VNNATRYEIRDTSPGHHEIGYSIRIADPSKALPAEVIGWLETGAAALVAIDADGSERIVSGGAN